MIIIITNIIFLSLLISLNYEYCYDILFRNLNVFCSQLSLPVIFVSLFVSLFVFVCLFVFCNYVLLQFILECMLSLPTMYLCISVLCSVCHWPCSC
jgi:hypothetical protein